MLHFYTDCGKRKTYARIAVAVISVLLSGWHEEHCLHRYGSRSPPQTLQRGVTDLFPPVAPECRLPRRTVSLYSKVTPSECRGLISYSTTPFESSAYEVIPPASVSVLAPAGREQSTNSNAVIAHSARLQSLFTRNSSENRIFSQTYQLFLAYFTVHFNPFPNSYCNFSTFVTEYSNSALIFRSFLPPNRT